MNNGKSIEMESWDVVCHTRHPERGLFLMLIKGDDEAYVHLSEDEVKKLSHKLKAFLGEEGWKEEDF